ncbi:aquaporin, partial [Aeromicrobium sp.]
VDNTSVNPARSLGVAWFAGGDALAQVWIFILAPIVGAVIAGLTHSLILGGDD